MSQRSRRTRPNYADFNVSASDSEHDSSSEQEYAPSPEKRNPSDDEDDVGGARGRLVGRYDDVDGLVEEDDEDEEDEDVLQAAAVKAAAVAKKAAADAKQARADAKAAAKKVKTADSASRKRKRKSTRSKRAKAAAKRPHAVEREQFDVIDEDNPHHFDSVPDPDEWTAPHLELSDYSDPEGDGIVYDEDDYKEDHLCLLDSGWVFGAE